jgi:hypothetical protein
MQPTRRGGSRVAVYIDDTPEAVFEVSVVRIQAAARGYLEICSKLGGTSEALLAADDSEQRQSDRYSDLRDFFNSEWMTGGTEDEAELNQTADELEIEWQGCYSQRRKQRHLVFWTRVMWFGHALPEAIVLIFIPIIADVKAARRGIEQASSLRWGPPAQRSGNWEI